MSHRIRARSAGTILLSVVAAALVAGPVPVAGHGPLPLAAAPSERMADLAPALATNGTFVGAPGLAGTVDASAWALVSDLAAGEPPRFAPAANAVSPATATGPWSALGSNSSGDGALNTVVYALAVSGTNLYVGGNFTDAAGIPGADYIAKWNGSAWSALGSPGSNGALNYYVYALAVFGSDLYVGGDFSNAAGIAEADAIAKWNGSAWSALGSNTSHDDGAVNGHVSALAVSDSDLYVGGYFTDAAGLPEADFIAKWNGTWSALGSNGSGNGALNNEVDALAVSASGLYVGGDFTDAAGNPKADRIAKWNGGAWSALGSNGANDGALNSSVYALAVSGGDVYVGGRFANAAGIAKADYVARWDGTWSALGSNSSSTDGALNAGVNALAVSGSDLFVGGGFTDAAGIATADRVAKWNGSSWSALGSNGSGDGAINSYVDALAVSGTSLYVGGSFNDAAGIHAADYIAKWGPGSAVVRKPDGRIRLGSSGAFVGDNVYNTTGAGQSVAGSAKKGKTIVYQVSVQNDGSAADRFKLKASGTATSKFTVKYFKGSTDITRKVVAGTYRTSSLGVGAALTITVKVTVKSAAAVGTSVTRLLTITSAGNSASKDAVKLVGTRA